MHWLSSFVNQGEYHQTRSSLQGGAVLVWLMGDTQLIRDDAKLYFRKTTKEDEGPDDKPGPEPQRTKVAPKVPNPDQRISNE